MKNNSYSVAMSEVLSFLSGIRQEDVNKIPKSLLHFIESKSDKSYISRVNYNKPLTELGISDEAKYVISYICYKYWCDTPEKKHHFSAILKSNDDYINELNWEKYNPEKIFESKDIEETKQNNEVALIEQKQSKLDRFLKKIFSFFKINKKG